MRNFFVLLTLAFCVSGCVKIPERSTEKTPGAITATPIDTPAAPQTTLETARKNYEAGDLARAESEFAEIVVAEPKNSDALYYLGRTRLERGDAERAAVSLREAVKLDGKKPIKLMALGDALFALKRYDVAIVEYGKIIGFEPDNAQAYYKTGRTYIALGNKIAARQQVRKLEQIDKPLAEKLSKEIGN